MAVNNSLAKATQKSDLIKYDANGETVQLSKNLIKSLLVNGNGAVTDQEVTMFLSLCKFQHLNPFIREAYLIKYGNSPATVVVGKEVLLKRAMRSPKFEGLQAGVIVLSPDGKLVEREGTFVLENETLVGGWAKVFLNNYINPVYASVSMKEYSTGKSNWLSKPATMIRKVALAQALREAFPEEMSALYDQAEIKEVSDMALDTTPVNAPDTPSNIAEVNEPVQTVATPAEANVGGQGSIDDIMFGSQAASLVDESNQPPFEV